MSRGDADRIAAISAAEAAGMRSVHDGGAAGHARERKSAAESLGHGDQIGHHARVLDGEHLAGARDAALHLVGDQDDAVLVAEPAQSAQELERRHVEAALALDRLDDDGRDRLRIHVAVEQPVQIGERLFGA